MNRRIFEKSVQLPTSARSLDPILLPTYAQGSYQAIGLNDLLAYAVHYLEVEKSGTTFENIAVAAHRMFPSKFSLVGYSQFPDAARVQLVILHLGPKYVGWLDGKKKTGYRLNARGREAAKAVSLHLGESLAMVADGDIEQDNVPNRTAVDTRLVRLRESEAFRLHASGQGQSLDDVSLAWGALGLFVTADGPTKVETHRQLVELARRVKDSDAEKFLAWLAKERPHLVGKSPRETRKPRGHNASNRRE